MRLIAKAVSKDYLDVSFQSGTNTVEIVERPGRWMTADRLEKLRSDLTGIATATLETGALDYGVLSGNRERLENAIVTLVRRTSDGKPVAFNALSLMDCNLSASRCRIIHLGLVMIDPQERQKGLSWILYGLTCLLLFIRGGLRPLYVSNVTQVPAVVGMVCETFSEVCPSPEEPEPSDFRKILIAREIMQNHRHVFGVGADADFDEKRFVIRNAYTGGSDDLKKTIEQTTRHRDEKYNTWCRNELNYDRGDDVLQIGLIDLAAAQRYVARAVPRGSLMQLAALGTLVFARRVFLPAAHWFNSEKDYGLLRAR
ncbi:MAG: hypothetical protein RIE06_29500 [Roseibium album]|uniref:hypothetical protein n=1 Tax=Roseibium album TaxID=311410 RepID=UPI000CF1C41D|nr:hypothetical protein [Roseibium album]MBG6143101.1 hypothetical protein [Labrenzia sp. EL_142]MBG6166388.1 hypothetical protein [Labrenzia sp. EL_195]